MNTNFKKTSIFITVILFILLIGGQVFAYNTKTSKKNNLSLFTQNRKEKSIKNLQTLNEVLDSLVKDGKITSTQKEKIVSYVKIKEDERKAEKEKLKKMDEKQREEYFKNAKKNVKKDMFDDLVDQKVITQQQADTIKKALFEKNKSTKIENFKSQLENQVKTGIITKDEENKIIEYMNKKINEKKAEMEKVKNMTSEERKAYFENKKSQPKSDFYKELVDQGILTQEKADNLKKAMQGSEKQNRHFKFKYKNK
ncbi:hypothetical protein FDN13_10430 [Caloramator sp. E03]|uniref:hypothetical protein n=1 Tax=Caloramator sp. E03 TaxID=2576307 RepID=UPI0011101845|nr:hypothetical protein [Caloramator sp. E03]QCX34088.1 hypothetical protein FDN13_10430 [Caloramator sp. E03]